MLSSKTGPRLISTIAQAPSLKSTDGIEPRWEPRTARAEVGAEGFAVCANGHVYAFEAIFGDFRRFRREPAMSSGHDIREKREQTCVFHFAKKKKKKENKRNTGERGKKRESLLTL